MEYVSENFRGHPTTDLQLNVAFPLAHFTLTSIDDSGRVTINSNPANPGLNLRGPGAAVKLEMVKPCKSINFSCRGGRSETVTQVSFFNNKGVLLKVVPILTEPTLVECTAEDISSFALEVRSTEVEIKSIQFAY